jgi:hypothetical protein
MADDDERGAGEDGTSTAGTGAEPDPQLALLKELLDDHATVAGDVLQIDAHTWAIHGTIAVDGDVIMAEYDSEERARIVLDELSTRGAEDQRAGQGGRHAGGHR